jgi:hypothetical protein
MSAPDLPLPSNFPDRLKDADLPTAALVARFLRKFGIVIISVYAENLVQ